MDAVWLFPPIVSLLDKKMELILSALPSIMLAYLINRLEKVETKVNDLKGIVLVIKSHMPNFKYEDD